MDIVDDEEDEDISFVPNAILNHRIMKTPRCEIHKSKDEDGKEVTNMKVIRDPHLRVQVKWKNEEISWVDAATM